MFKIKSFSNKNQLFPTCALFFLACPLLRGNFDMDNPGFELNTGLNTGLELSVR